MRPQTIRPQNGLIEARLFREGDLVREGQPLYRIDAAPYEAQVANAMRMSPPVQVSRTPA
jgi:multidrug efflux pump subunit AcrA (membrane-fusion protein)